MIRSLWTAATGMQAQALNIDVISNNLANVNTTGFKKSRADFQDLLYETLSPAGVSSSAVTQVPTGMQVGLGTKPVAIQKIFMQGDYQYTKNELNVAIEGDGFFSDLAAQWRGCIYQVKYLKCLKLRNAPPAQPILISHSTISPLDQLKQR